MVKDKNQVLAEVKYYFRAATNAPLKNHQIEIQDDLSVVIDTSITMVEPPPQGKLPIRLHMVEGSVTAAHMELTTLENFPDVCDSLYVKDNWITSLDHSPMLVNSLDVSYNKLSNFEHVSEECTFLYALNNPLTSLLGLPDQPVDELEVVIDHDPNLPLLRLLNASRIVVGDFGRAVEPLTTILNKYAGEGKHAALKAALELKDAGYVGNARW